MKRIVSMLLTIVLLFSLAACGAPVSEPGAGAESTAPITEQMPAPEPETPSEPADAEIHKAISLGLVPEEIQGDYDAPITFRQYSEMLTNLVALWNESKLPEWKTTIAAAAQSDDEMRREDGILELACAMVLMGQNEPGFGDADVDRIMAEVDPHSDMPSWDYPLFPNWEEVGFEWCGSNYMWGGVFTCAIKQSKISGKAIYPFEPDGDQGYMQSVLTRRDAITAVLRFGELDAAVLEPDGEYISVADVGGYDRSIITDALLSAPSDLPEPTQSALPSQWQGAGLSSSKNRVDDYKSFSEGDIRLLSDNGFNFTRVFFGFETLRFPDFPEDGRLVNENELQDLDQLVAWGIEHGVHIQIAMSFYLDGGGCNKQDGTLPASNEEWSIVRDYWAMLARRYAGISNRYLTFDLCNEIQPFGDDDFEAAKTGVANIAAAIREQDGERVLLYSFQGNPTLEWVDAMASLGLALGCHPYYPQYITTSGWEYVEQNPYAEPVWPLPWFPIGQISQDKAPLTLTGAIAGKTVSFHVEQADDDSFLDVYADGKPLEKLNLTGGEERDGVRYFTDTLFSVHIPDGVQTVEVRTVILIDTVIVEGAGTKTVIVPHDACDYMDYSVPLPLVINEDGTYTNSENRLIDGEEIYNADILPYLQIAEKHNVGFMVNEFGMFGNNIYWDIGIVAAYHDSVLRMLEEKGIGWCYCELYNPVPKHIVTMYGEDSQWSGSTMESIEVSTQDGTRTLRVNRELLDVFRKYTME